MSNQLAIASSSQLRWRCRRGMLELDILLNNFMDNEYSTMDDLQCRDFEKLLEYPDQILHDMLMGNMSTINREVKDIVNRIQQSFIN